MISLKQNKKNIKKYLKQSIHAGNWSQKRSMQMYFIILVVRSNYLKSTYTLTHSLNEQLTLDGFCNLDGMSIYQMCPFRPAPSHNLIENKKKESFNLPFTKLAFSYE